MKIFVLLPRIPWPLEKGDKLRAYNQIKQLAKNNEIILCALNDDKKVDKQAAFQAMQPYCSSVNFIDLPKIGITGNSHFMFQELNNQEIADHIKAWLNERGLG